MDMQKMWESKNADAEKKTYKKIRIYLNILVFLFLIFPVFFSYSQEISRIGDLYRKGIEYLLLREFLKAREILNTALEKEKNNPQVSPLEMNLLIREGMKKGKIFEQKLEKEDLYYLWRCFKYQEVASLWTKNYSEEEKLKRLFEKVRWEISTTNNKEWPATPWDILIRGYGQCDRIAWVFLTLSQQLGYSGGLFYFLDKEGKGFHTVTLLIKNGEVRLYDPYLSWFALPFSRLSKDKIYFKRFYPSDWWEGLKRGVYLVASEAESYLPVFRRLEENIKKYKIPFPRTYINIEEELKLAIQAVLSPPRDKSLSGPPFFLENTGLKVSIWKYPFLLRKLYNTPHYYSHVENREPYFRILKRVRLLYLRRKLNEAMKEIEKAKSIIPDEKSETLEYYLFLIYLERNEKEKAKEIVLPYLEGSKKTSWSEEIKRKWRLFEEGHEK